MLFWILIAALTATAMLAVLLPLLSRRSVGEAVPKKTASDKDVYRQQLDELAEDEAQGRIGPAEAKAARAEVARRLIAAEHSGSTGRGAATDGRLRRRLVAVAGLVAVPAFALSLYLAIGMPDLPGQPLAARIAAAHEGSRVAELVSRVEGHLARNPEDGSGWEVLAPVYMRINRPADAATAWRNTIRILGSTASRQANLGEALVVAEGGIVKSDARKAFQAAIEHEPKAPKPRFFLALARKQDGDAAGAAEDWRALLAEAPPDAPYRRSIELALADGKPQSGNPPASPSGPTAEDMASAESMPAGEQQAMINDMVSRLAERLASEPDDIDGWLRLVRSYAVLGRHDDAKEAAATGMKSVSATDDRARIANLAAELGIALEE